MPNNSIVTRADLRYFMLSDLEAHGYKQWHLYSFIVRPQLHYQRILRKVEYWYTRRDPFSKLCYVFFRLRLARLSQKLGMSIPPGVFGPGLCIQHYGTIVVNDKARFGAWCTIHTSTNIGERNGSAPVGGESVYIGPGAILYGGITIGDRVMIGANSVLNSDVPSGVSVAGAPARIIRHAE